MSNAKDVKDNVFETIKTIVYAFLIAGVFKTFFFQPFFIPSSSMKETLLVGDFLFVNKMSYGYSKWSCPKVANFLCPISGRVFGSDPERGDIVVFIHPTQKREFVKRLVGLPGDTIQMKEGFLYINGEKSEQVDAGEFVETYESQGTQGGFPRCSNDAPAAGGDCVKQRLTETFPDGHQHVILNVDNTAADNTPIYTVPAASYFFIGDNRDNSGDSRMAQPYGVGFVSEEFLLGRVNRVVFSAAGKRIVHFWTWRKDRFLQKLQ